MPEVFQLDTESEKLLELFKTKNAINIISGSSEKPKVATAENIASLIEELKAQSGRLAKITPQKLPQFSIREAAKTPSMEPEKEPAKPEFNLTTYERALKLDGLGKLEALMSNGVRELDRRLLRAHRLGIGSQLLTFGSGTATLVALGFAASTIAAIGAIVGTVVAVLNLAGEKVVTGHIGMTTERARELLVEARWIESEAKDLKGRIDALNAFTFFSAASYWFSMEALEVAVFLNNKKRATTVENKRTASEFSRARFFWFVSTFCMVFGAGCVLGCIILAALAILMIQLP